MNCPTQSLLMVVMVVPPMQSTGGNSNHTYVIYVPPTNFCTRIITPSILKSMVVEITEV